MSAFPRTCRGNPHASRESGLLNRSRIELSSPKSEDPEDGGGWMAVSPIGAGGVLRFWSWRGGGERDCVRVGAAEGVREGWVAGALEGAPRAS